MNTAKKVDGFDYIKTKGFCSTKDTMDKVNRELAEWEKIYAMSKPNKGSTSSYPRNTNKSTRKKKAAENQSTTMNG